MMLNAGLSLQSVTSDSLSTQPKPGNRQAQPQPARYNGAMSQLMVNEIFRSLQGEGTRAGLPCTFVRLAGCNLRCAWCDTTYAYDEGTAMELRQVLARVAELGCRRVEVTGGEPLIQAATPELLRALCDGGYETLLETNGSCDIGDVDPRVVRIVDIKCPSSGESGKMHRPNLARLAPGDELKFVLAGRADFDFAREVLERHKLIGRCAVIFSPVAGQLAPATLAAWILEGRLDVRLGLQLHKILWPQIDRGV